MFSRHGGSFLQKSIIPKPTENQLESEVVKWHLVNMKMAETNGKP